MWKTRRSTAWVLAKKAVKSSHERLGNVASWGSMALYLLRRVPSVNCLISKEEFEDCMGLIF
jgi:hypothetical protein